MFLILFLPFGETSTVFANSMQVEQNFSSEISKPDISASSALLVEYETGTVIYEKNADERLPIASMTKLASLSVIFDAISKGLAKETDIVSVSETAAAVGGSSAFLDAGSKYKLTDLIKTVVVASANDSTVALAEHIAGSEDVFVSKMNKLAANLGLNDTRFSNCTGLPVKNHYSTANDMTKIYKTVCNNPIYKKYSKIWMDDFIHPSGRKTGLVNTNRLVKTYDGIEGGKTGYTDSARFCLTASAKRGNLRLIGVLIGANDSKTRFAEMTKLFNFGFSNYTNKLVVNSEIPVSVLSIKKAKLPVEVFASHDISMFMEKTDDNTFTTDFSIDENIKAPLKAGDKVGKIFVFDKNNMVVCEAELVVKKDVQAEKLVDDLRKIVHAW
jgi:D-alanyl-D-alanine carboxypeptidase (penicillin-binding protein 5/6)